MEGGMNREPTDKELSGGVICDGLGSSFAALFGVLPNTSFSQNVGLIAMTKVVNRMVIGVGACIMILAGIFPFFGAVLATLPDAVLGGCTIMMFGSIVVSGMKMIAACGFEQRNITIAALSLGIGIGFTQGSGNLQRIPANHLHRICGNCVAVVFIVAIVANLDSAEGQRSGEGGIVRIRKTKILCKHLSRCLHRIFFINSLAFSDVLVL